MKIKISIIIAMLSVCTMGIRAHNLSLTQPAYPQVWNHPDSVITHPNSCDTILLPASYTMMMVYRSLCPDTMQQLWKINREDGKYYSVGTHAISTERWEMPLSSTIRRSNACIYTMQHTLQLDTSYHDIVQFQYPNSK